jgi:hypothetical protein
MKPPYLAGGCLKGGAKQFDMMRRKASALRQHVLSLHQGDPPWIGDVIAATQRVAGPFPLNDILLCHDGTPVGCV